jgi:hypothetical protein
MIINDGHDSNWVLKQLQGRQDDTSRQRIHQASGADMTPLRPRPLVDSEELRQVTRRKMEEIAQQQRMIDDMADRRLRGEAPAAELPMRAPRLRSCPCAEEEERLRQAEQRRVAALAR